MNKHEQRDKDDLAEHNAAEKRTLEDEVRSLTRTLQRWRYSVIYLVAAVTLAVLLQLYLILE
jgi:hypothetical protein